MIELKSYHFLMSQLEQAAGIEPATSAWEANILPLNYACTLVYYISLFTKFQ